jgi:dipeptidyl aminopeptidase/acylaminoacyl peptidase
VYDSNLHLNAEIFRMPIGGGSVERLTTDPAHDFCPDVSLDGTELAYHSWKTGSRDIFITKLDGGTPQQLTATPSQEAYPSWSPDGRTLAYWDNSVVDGQARGAFLMRRASSGTWTSPALLRQGTSYKALWLPDGRSLAVPRQGAIEIIDVESKAIRILYAPSSPGDPAAESLARSEDGQTIYFKSHDAERRASFWSVPLAGGRPKLLVQFSDLSRPSIRPDFAVAKGQFFFTLEDRQADIWVAEIARR